MSNQSTTFKDGEADEWFLRNKSALNSCASETSKGFPEIDWLGSELAPFASATNSILEIGCSNGAKLESLCKILGARGHGIDPSSLAVMEGNARLAEGVLLCTGTASSLPFETESFDFVYFGFCLYLLDRHDLFKAIAEADRVLKCGGFLAVTDFDPIHRQKRPHHHKDGVFSYKQDYSKLFTSGGNYYLVSKKSYSLKQSFFDSDGGERVSTTLLFKELDAY